VEKDSVKPQSDVTIENLKELTVRAGALIAELRERMLMPNAQKSPPILLAEKVAELCNLNPNQWKYRVNKINKSEKAGLPLGTINNANRREFSVEETQAWTRSERKDFLRPKGAKAVVVGIAFFKGGVTKTTTAMTLAQGLSLLGHRVLNIDMDPQGSLTTLHGLLPDTEIDDEDTLGPLFSGEQEDVRYAIRKTYWPGIDLIPAASALFSAEFALPTQQMNDPGRFEFWNVLNKGLESVRDEYDVILIDTPPSLSYMTINAFFAADGMIIPMTTSMLDMASSAQFWSLFSDLAESISKRMTKPKKYDFINILLAKVNNNESTTRLVRSWISTVYGGKVMQTEIPLTAVSGSAASEFATVFDISKYVGDSRTYKRARTAYEELALAVEESIRQVWAKGSSK
jgi:chromosome partitioning protein